MDFNPNEATIICVCCLNAGKPILVASRSGGQWCFLCGDRGHEEEGEEIDRLRAVHLAHVVNLDPSIRAVLNLKADYTAHRDAGHVAWRCYYDPDE